MRLRVLGSSAGGGFPQWNCNCPNCDGLRRGSIQARPRTQSSVALTANGVDWLLINASPEVLQQLRETPELQPARQIRDSGVAAVLLIDAQIDHCTGLLMLLFVRGNIMPEAKNPLNRFLIWAYRPVIAAVMRWKKTTIALAGVSLLLSLYPASRLGSVTPDAGAGNTLNVGENKQRATDAEQAKAVTP